MSDAKDVKEDAKKAQNEDNEDPKGENVNDGKIVEDIKKTKLDDNSQNKVEPEAEKTDTTQIPAKENR